MGKIERTSPYLQTFLGIKFYPLEPLPLDIEIEDIAHALSNLCRFGGHSKLFYSVAEHCIHAFNFAPQQYKLEALLHDASEAYLVDVPRPIKSVLSHYKQIELGLERAISLKYGLEFPLPQEVKIIDERLLASESIWVMGGPKFEWYLNVSPYSDFEPLFLEPTKAKYMFLDYFERAYEQNNSS